MNSNEAKASTKFRVGLFTLFGIALIFGLTVFVNDKPFWWRSCQLVHINVEDATGLKSKSPIRSLGLDIGYLKTVDLAESYVSLGICLTAPIEVLPSTRAYIRSEGFLGDRFVELKPIRYLGPADPAGAPKGTVPQSAPETPTPDATQSAFPDGQRDPASEGILLQPLQAALAFLVPGAAAAEPVPPAPRGTSVPAAGREIPVGEEGQDVQKLVGRVDTLVNEVTGLANNLKQAINPEELRSTMTQLNKALQNASQTLAPEGGLNQTAQRTLSKLEDAVEQLRDMLTRINQGQGSVGMLLNDKGYAEEIREAIRNVNRLLSKVSGIRFVVDVGAEQIEAYDGGRGWFRLGIWPETDRYYLLGVSIDPRGRRTDTVTTTTVNGVSTVLTTSTAERTGIIITAMLGKVFFQDRLDVAVGALHGDGTLSAAVNLGPTDDKQRFRLRGDVYSETGSSGGAGGTRVDVRLNAQARLWSGLYFRAGTEGFRKVNGKLPYTYGAGITFDDDDIKLLFSFL